jgi:hypothetical protein
VNISKLPEFEDILLALSEEEMRAAAKQGRVIAINISRHRCDAILIERHQIRSLALPYLESEEIEEKGKRGSLKSLKVPEWLWDV